MNDAATISDKPANAELTTCASDSYVLQYQPVYDQDYVLRAIRLRRRAAQGGQTPTWTDVVTHYPDARGFDFNPLLIDVQTGDQPDAMNDALRAGDILLIDAVAHDAQAVTAWSALAIEQDALLGYINDQPAMPGMLEPQPLKLVNGITTLDALDSAWANGAQFALGWPVLGDVVANDQTSKGESNLQLILELMKRIDQAEHVDNIEPLLDQSPTLSYRLLRYLNSPASGLDREIDSLRHAVMLVGYGQLKSWLALLLATAVESPRARPLIDASIRRAHLMQEFADRLGISQTHGDMFVCGVFSLLDQILGKPMSELLATLPLSDEAAQCLNDNDGPYAPYLTLVRQLESEEAFDIHAACDMAALTVPEVNQSIISSLKKAHATS